MINDHQLVRSQAGWGCDFGRRDWKQPCPSAHSLLSQFEQMRQSVVLTSNFAKSVVNLADVVSSPPSPSLSSHTPH